MATLAVDDFFITGGTLPADALSYVERAADQQLWETLREGEFCYVLTSRQMGKSSLMVRTASRLRQEGMNVAVLDLTAIGSNLSPVQWYRGMVSLIGQQLDLEEEMTRRWRELSEYGPVQRFMQTLRDVAIEERPGRLVIFVDEVDAVLSLPFQADELFAAIRECFNGRRYDSTFSRLGFCLLGVTTPSNLCRDARTTPFNIGQQIVLSDFSPEEAQILSIGLRMASLDSALRPAAEGKRLLRRVLWWTGGHPYLTQRLCQAVAQEPHPTCRTVDRVCKRLFLTRNANERDDNLVFVGDHLLRSGMHIASLLGTYESVLRGRRVADEPANEFLKRLKLSGIVQCNSSGRLQVRNRIYRQVFDKRWITEQLPVDEAQRLRRAYWRGARRALAVAGLVGSTLVAASFGVQQHSRARQSEKLARRDRFVVDLNEAQEAIRSGDYPRATALLTAYVPRRGEEDLRGFEWRYLWACSHQDAASFRDRIGVIRAVAFTDQTRSLITASERDTVCWDRSTADIKQKYYERQMNCTACALSPGGRLRASATTQAGTDYGVQEAEILVRRAGGASVLHTFRVPGFSISSLAFSPDERFLVAGSENAAARGGEAPFYVFDLTSGDHFTLAGHPGRISRVAVSATGELVASGGSDGRIRIWHLGSRALLASFSLERPIVSCLAFGDEDRLLAAGSVDRENARYPGAFTVWSIAGRKVLVNRELPFVIRCCSISPDARLLAVGGDDRSLHLFDRAAGRWLPPYRGHIAGVSALSFSPDGYGIASGAMDGEAKLWPTQRKPTYSERRLAPGPIQWLSFSGDARVVAIATETVITVVDDRRRTRCETRVNACRNLAFARGSAVLAATTENGVRLFDLRQGTLHPFPKLFKKGSRCLAVSDNGKRLAVRSGESVWIHDARKSSPFSLKLTGGADGASFSPTGESLAITSDRSLLELWDLERKCLIFRTPTAGRGVVEFSPRGDAIAWARGGRVQIYDTAGRLTMTLHSGVERVTAVAFSPDGKSLATTSTDRMVRLWHLASGRQTLALSGSPKGNCAVSFDENGTLLAVGGNDGRIREWRTGGVE